MVGRFLLGFSLLFAVVSVSYAQSPFDSDTYYRLEARHSGKCLDVRDLSVVNGGSLQQYDCSPFAQPNQLWNVLETPGGGSTGPFRVVSANSAKCIDVPNASTANGVYLQQYDCNLAWPQSNQVYTIYGAPTAGYYRVSPTSAPTKCLDVENVSTANGANVQQYDCGPFYNANQDWAFVPYIARTPLTHIQSFGYYFSGPASIWGNVRDHGNLATLPTYEQSPSPLADLANASMQTGVQAIVDLGPFFRLSHKVGNDIYFSDYGCQEPDDIPPTVCDGGLRADYIAEWTNNWKPLIDPYVGSVGAFYMLDEPLWNFKARQTGFTDADVLMMLGNLASVVKQTYPNIPIIVVEGGDRIGVNSYPAAIDWIGFDYYSCAFNPCYQQLMAAQKSLLVGNQQMVVVPLGNVVKTTGNNGDLSTTQAEQDALVADAQFFINVALAEPKVVGLLVFMGGIVPSNPPHLPQNVGVFQMPEVHDQWRFLMRGLGLGTP